MLAPCQGKAPRACDLAYGGTGYDRRQAAMYGLAGFRPSQHARRCLDDWRCTHMCSEFSHDQPMFAQDVDATGCMAHACRKVQQAVLTL